MTDTDIPSSTRVVQLAARPQGALSLDLFRTVETPLAAPEPGHVLVRTEYLGLAAVMRELMEPESAVPVPQFELDRPLTGFVVGTVVASGADANGADADGADAGVAVGDLVTLHAPWADYADARAADVTVLDPGVLPAPWYHLATGNGATALLGVKDVAGVTAGDVVWVSGAAGGVGALAGQIAKRLGAATVIGTAGSRDKCRWLVEELGFDVAVNYRDDDWVDQLRKAAPEGITVYVDLVGGTQFEAAVELAATHARFAVAGALAGQAGADWPRFDTQTAIPKDLTIRPYALANGRHVFGEWPGLFSRWLAEGMVYPHTIVEGGIEAAPQALVDLLGGRYTGNVAVRLA